MDRSEKEALVASMHETFEGASTVVVTQYLGLTVAEITDLREKLREAGASLKVTKNRLTRLALKDTKFEELSELFSGPTAIAFSADPVAPAKVAAEFAKSNEKLQIVGGGIGEKVLDVAGVQALANMPSLDESRATIVGLLTASASKLARVIQAPSGQVARVIGAYSEKGEAA